MIDINDEKEKNVVVFSPTEIFLNNTKNRLHNVLVNFDVFGFFTHDLSGNKDILTAKVKSGPISCECKKINNRIIQFLYKLGLNFDVKKGDVVAELHVDAFDFSFQHIGKNLGNIDKELMLLENRPKYIVGLSKLSKYASRYGFETKKITEDVRLCWKKIPVK